MSSRNGQPHFLLVDHLLASRRALSRTEIMSEFGEHALRACLEERSVARVLPGTYCAAIHVDQGDVRIRAASSWIGNRGAISGVAGAWLWGVLDEPPPRVTVHVGPHLNLASPDWLRIVRPATDPTTFVTSGVRVVKPADAVLQGWCELPGSPAIGLVVEAVRRRVVTAQGIVDAARDRPRVRSRADLAHVLVLLDGGVTSYLEYVARSDVFPTKRFPHLRWQVSVRARGRVRRLDAFDDEAKLALEFDSRSHHSSEHDRLDDINRDAELATIGIQTLRFTFDAIVNRPQWCREVYLAARSARLSARVDSVHESVENGRKSRGNLPKSTDS